MASDKSPSEDPRLVFNLPGTWFPVAITDEGASEQDVERMVQGIVGPADDAAVLRRQMHDQVSMRAPRPRKAAPLRCTLARSSKRTRPSL